VVSKRAIWEITISKHATFEKYTFEKGKKKEKSGRVGRSFFPTFGCMLHL
jgi:hypothetical protein